MPGFGGESMCRPLSNAGHFSSFRHLGVMGLTPISSLPSLAWNSRSDARGLIQVLHGPWDPKENIEIGCTMLAGLLAQFHDLTLALAAYNAGPNAVLSYGGGPP